MILRPGSVVSGSPHTTPKPVSCSTYQRRSSSGSVVVCHVFPAGSFPAGGAERGWRRAPATTGRRPRMWAAGRSQHTAGEVVVGTLCGTITLISPASGDRVAPRLPAGGSAVSGGPQRLAGD